MVVGLLAVLTLLAPFDTDAQLDEGTGPWPYIAVFFLVFGDAVVPVLPGETTLKPRPRSPHRESSSWAG